MPLGSLRAHSTHTVRVHERYARFYRSKLNAQSAGNFNFNENEITFTMKCLSHRNIH